METVAIAKVALEKATVDIEFVEEVVAVWLVVAGAGLVIITSGLIALETVLARAKPEYVLLNEVYLEISMLGCALLLAGSLKTSLVGMAALVEARCKVVFLVVYRLLEVVDGTVSAVERVVPRDIEDRFVELARDAVIAELLLYVIGGYEKPIPGAVIKVPDARGAVLVVASRLPSAVVSGVWRYKDVMELFLNGTRKEKVILSIELDNVATDKTELAAVVVAGTYGAAEPGDDVELILAVAEEEEEEVILLTDIGNQVADKAGPATLVEVLPVAAG
ncbi:hypothetical protein H2203_005973 [Taxawa tesnikishii (nom. ined.)]|nr:hypothetical protein H2203_005973 [Dothideales sp. JES 119]